MEKYNFLIKNLIKYDIKFSYDLNTNILSSQECITEHSIYIPPIRFYIKKNKELNYIKEEYGNTINIGSIYDIYDRILPLFIINKIERLEKIRLLKSTK